MTLPTAAGSRGPSRGVPQVAVLCCVSRRRRSRTTGTDSVDPRYYGSPTEQDADRARERRRKNHPPSRSVSPTNQAAGVLFRMSQGAVIESICVGVFEPPREMSLAGQPLPPPTKDYGFSYASRERIHTDDSNRSNGPYSIESPDGNEDYYEARPTVTPTPAGTGRGRGRKPSHPPNPRVCISCGATKTPYWREAWSNTVLLCNACGLRFSKFRRRCLDCSYVPRKEDKGSKSCTKCGGPWS